jgi:hypothetical protein
MSEVSKTIGVQERKQERGQAREQERQQEREQAREQEREQERKQEDNAGEQKERHIENPYLSDAFMSMNVEGRLARYFTDAINIARHITTNCGIRREFANALREQTEEDAKYFQGGVPIAELSLMKNAIYGGVSFIAAFCGVEAIQKRERMLHRSGEMKHQNILSELIDAIYMETGLKITGIPIHNEYFDKRYSVKLTGRLLRN